MNIERMISFHHWPGKPWEIPDENIEVIQRGELFDLSRHRLIMNFSTYGCNWTQRCYFSGLCELMSDDFNTAYLIADLLQVLEVITF